VASALRRIRFDFRGSSSGSDSGTSAVKRGSNVADCIRLYVVLVGVREARVKKGSNRVPRGAGNDDDVLPRALSNSSTYMSAIWYARLAGTRISLGLNVGVGSIGQGEMGLVNSP
jgi:hypothetical protein